MTVQHSSTPGCDFEGRQLPSLDICENADEKVRILFNEVLYMSSRIDKNQEEDLDRQKEQSIKDQAQDQLLSMELDGIKRDVRKRITHKDLASSKEKIDTMFKTFEGQLEERMDLSVKSQEEYLQEQVDRVKDQLNQIQEAQDDNTTMMRMNMKKIEGTLKRMEFNETKSQVNVMPACEYSTDLSRPRTCHHPTSVEGE